MAASLTVGIFFVLGGITVTVLAAKHYETDRTWKVGVFLATIIITLGIFFISLSFRDMGRQDDPLPAVTEQGHIYKVLDSMKFKKGYLVSFKKIIPRNKEEARVRFFEKVPPNPFESILENNKQIYIPFELPNPVK